MDKGGPPPTNAEGEVDENHWAQAAADQAAGHEQGDEMDDSELPIYLLFFHETDVRSSM